MISRDEAKLYYDEVVIPAIEELAKEYEPNKSIRIKVIGNKLTTGGPRFISEAYGIHIIFPNETEKKISVNWVDNFDSIVIGLLGAAHAQSFPIRETDKETLKIRIREIIGPIPRKWGGK